VFEKLAAFKREKGTVNYKENFQVVLVFVSENINYFPLLRADPSFNCYRKQCIED
jgi:hypothetical protein